MTEDDELIFTKLFHFSVFRKFLSVIGLELVVAVHTLLIGHLVDMSILRALGSKR